MCMYKYMNHFSAQGLTRAYRAMVHMGSWNLHGLVKGVQVSSAFGFSLVVQSATLFVFKGELKVNNCSILVKLKLMLSE